MTTIWTALGIGAVGGLVFLILNYIESMRRRRETKAQVINIKTVKEIVEAREELKKLKEDNTRNREDYQAKLEAYREKYRNNPLPEPSGDSSSPGPKKL